MNTPEQPRLRAEPPSNPADPAANAGERVQRIHERLLDARVADLNVAGAVLRRSWEQGREDPATLQRFNAAFADILRIDNHHAYRILQAAKLLDTRGNFQNRSFGPFALSFDGEAVRVERIPTPREKTAVAKAPVANESIRAEADRMVREVRTEVEKMLPPKGDPARERMKLELDRFMGEFSSVIDGCVDIIEKHPEGFAELERSTGQFHPLAFGMKDPGNALGMLRAYAANGSHGPDARALLVEIADFLETKFPAKRKPKK